MAQGPRILLVDDETAIQRSVGPLLRSRGYDVDIAGTGAQALETFAARPPGLVVLDLGLPDLEGTEVCRRIRETSAVPIIVLSARGAEADKVNALDLGADDYVTKPFGPEELLARIRVALRRVAADADESRETGLSRGRLVDDRLRPAAGRAGRNRDPPDAQGVRPAVAPGATPRSRVDTPRHPEGRMGAERRRATRTSVDAGRAAAEEDRAGPDETAVPDQRTVGGLSVRDGSPLSTVKRASAGRGELVLRERLLQRT